jgi:hypothetical protein
MVYSNTAGFWVNDDPQKSYFEVFAPDVVTSFRIASIGKNYGLQRAIAEADKRAAMAKSGLASAVMTENRNL